MSAIYDERLCEIYQRTRGLTIRIGLHDRFSGLQHVQWHQHQDGDKGEHALVYLLHGLLFGRWTTCSQW